MARSLWQHAAVCSALLGILVSGAFSQHLSRASLHSATAHLPFRDPSLCVEARVDDLLGRKSIEEKAGQLFHFIMFSGSNGTLAPESAELHSTDFVIGTQLLSHFNLASQIDDPAEAATYVNMIQSRALETRLGIPVTISIDPRNAFTDLGWRLFSMARDFGPCSFARSQLGTTLR